MKKLFFMIVGMVTALCVQATEKLWDFSTWEIATFTETTTIDGLTIAATSEATVAVDNNSKGLFLSHTKRLKLGGTGKAESRNISFDVSGRSLITIAFMHSSSTGDPRSLCLAKNEFGNVVKTTTVGPSVISYLTYYHKGGDATYYAYSQNSGLNIYGIYVRDLTSDLVDVYDFAAEADADNNPTKMNTHNTFYVWKNNEASNLCTNPGNWRGYTWSEGSLLPKYDFVFTQNTQINGKLVKNNPVSGWKADNETRPIVIAGVTAGMKVTINYDASAISDAAKKQLIWASATGDGSENYASTAIIGEANNYAVSGETKIPSGLPIHIKSAEGGYIAVMPFMNMVIQSVKVEMEEDVPTYLTTTDFNSMDDADISEIPAELLTAIDGLDVVDSKTGTTLNISGSGDDATPNRYVVDGGKVKLELNGGVLTFTAPTDYAVKKVTFEYEEWNEANNADGGVAVEGTGIDVNAEKKTAEWVGSAPTLLVNIAGKTIIKSIKIEIGERIGEKVELDVEDGANLNKLVESTYSSNPYVGKITLNLAKDGKYTVDGPLFIGRPLVINGAEGAVIDASANSNPFILMRPIADNASLNESGAYEIDSIVIKDVKITGLKNRLLYADRQNYLFGKIVVENSIIQLDGSTPRSIFDFYCGGNFKELSILNSTLSADPSNAMRGGLVSTQSSKSIIEMGGESQKISIKNSTLYNIAYGKTPVLLQRHSQYYLNFELTGNIIANCGEKGNFVAGLNEGQKGANPTWKVSGNLFNFDGEDTRLAESTGDTAEGVENSVGGVVSFTAAADGDFNGEVAVNTAAPETLGDPRWTLAFNQTPKDIVIAPTGGDISEALETAMEPYAYIGNIRINLTNGGEYTISKTIVAPNSLHIVTGDIMALEHQNATIDASELEGPMITTPAEAPEEWVKANILVDDVTVKGLKKALFASAAKNYYYEQFSIWGSVIEVAADVTTLDFTKGSVANLMISSSTIYAPTATTKAFYSSQSGQKATEYAEDAEQQFIIFASTMYNLVPGKNFFTHRQSNQKWLAFNLQNNIFVNCGKSGQVVKGVNGGQSGENPKWMISTNLFNFDGQDTSAAEDTGDADEPVEKSIQGVVTFADAAAGDFNATINLAEGAEKPASAGDIYHWKVEYSEATGIEAVKTAGETSLENAVFYNLNGQRVEKPAKGLYIVNGKKVVMK